MLFNQLLHTPGNQERKNGKTGRKMGFRVEGLIDGKNRLQRIITRSLILEGVLTHTYKNCSMYSTGLSAQLVLLWPLTCAWLLG